MEERTKALLVGVNLNNDPEFETALKELESLAEACNMEVVGVETQNVSQINTGVYVGTGRVEEIKAVAHMMGAEVIIFDNTLSPMQLRNLKDIIERPVFDRTHLILQIFSSRARTREAQIQVETARLQYELPRLTGMGEILSRQGGGSGGLSNKGAGEKKLELDKRKIRHRISELKKELREVEKNRETQRKRRLVQGIPQVALVGYTNAGKSTLLNAFIDKYEENEEKKEDRKVMLNDFKLAYRYCLCNAPLYEERFNAAERIFQKMSKIYVPTINLNIERNQVADRVMAVKKTYSELVYADINNIQLKDIWWEKIIDFIMWRIEYVRDLRDSVAE